MGSFKISKLMLKGLFKKPATQNYPQTPKEWQERTRGHIEIEEASCILCGICMKKCPAQAITVVKSDRTWTINRMRCVQCGCCAEVCPKKCLHMNQVYKEPGTAPKIEAVEIPEAENKTSQGEAESKS